MVLRRAEPDKKAVSESLAAHEKQKKIFADYFLGSNKFVGGNTASIADILMATTLEQTSVAGAQHEALASYLEDVKTATDPAFYDELNQHVLNIPAVLKSMKML